MSYAALGGVLAALALAGAAYMQGRSDGKNDCEAAARREERIGQAAADSAASAAASAIARITVRHTTIRQEAEREIQVRTEYSDCRHSPEQLQRLNAALTGAPAGSAPGGGQLP